MRTTEVGIELLFTDIVYTHKFTYLHLEVSGVKTNYIKLGQKAPNPLCMEFILKSSGYGGGSLGNMFKVSIYGIGGPAPMGF